MNRITATFTIDSHTMTVAEVEKWAHDVIQGCKKSEKIWNMTCSVAREDAPVQVRKAKCQSCGHIEEYNLWLGDTLRMRFFMDCDGCKKPQTEHIDVGMKKT